MNIILLASVPHTGTEFIKHFIDAHPGVGNTVGLAQIRNNRGILADPYTGQGGLVPYTTNLVWSHINEDALRGVRCFAFHVPTVIPMRDPLLSVVTRKHRQPDMDHLWLIECWLVLATFIWPYSDAVYYPVDLEAAKTPEERYEGMKKMSRALHLQPDGYVKPFAEKFAPVNTRESYDLKKMYDERDFEQLSLHLKLEIQHLRHAEPYLRPMLEMLGYKDLMWWT